MASEPPNVTSDKADSQSPSQTLALSRQASTTSDGNPDEKFALGRKGILVVFTLCILTLMAALDGTSVSVALPVCRGVRDYLESMS